MRFLELMPRSKGFNNIVILAMFGAWVLIFAAPYGEALGIVPDDDGEDEQALDDLMSMPADITNRILKEFSSKSKLKSALQNTCLFSQARSTDSELIPHNNKSESFREDSMSRATPKLFQLFSVYRI